MNKITILTTLKEIVKNGTTNHWPLVKDDWEKYFDEVSNHRIGSVSGEYRRLENNKVKAKTILNILEADKKGWGHYPDEWTDGAGIKRLTCLCGNELPCPAFVPGKVDAPPSPDLVQDEFEVTGTVGPWQHFPLNRWTICGMHHYHVKKTRYLFVSMVREGFCITEEGPDGEYLWGRLKDKARKMEEKFK